MESKVSGHWTDEQLIDYLYGIGAEDAHVAGCAECQARLSGMRANRQELERSQADDEVSFEFLAAQRRRIYARLTEQAPWWSRTAVRQWASAAVAALVLAGGLLVYEQRQQPPASQSQPTDAQLVQEVSNMTQDSEPQAIAPLQELFEE